MGGIKKKGDLKSEYIQDNFFNTFSVCYTDDFSFDTYKNQTYKEA